MSNQQQQYWASVPLEWTDLTKKLNQDDLNVQPGKNPY